MRGPTRVSFALAWCLSAPIPLLADDAFLQPITVQLFPFSRAHLAPGYSGGYSKTSSRNDVIWIAPEIVVDKPLRSNGGDIILYANKISISAPIDSRLYVSHTTSASPRWNANELISSHL